jgi:4-carboxymuconolactone decarboxylase
MSDPKKDAAADIAAEIAAFRDGYVEMFGLLPPLPAARFSFSGTVNPAFLHKTEALRAEAFYSDVLDMKTTQLILFGMLLAEHNQAGAQAHAAAARRAGATWPELHKVVELAAATGALSAANTGSALLKTLDDKEQGGA